MDSKRRNRSRTRPFETKKLPVGVLYALGLERKLGGAAPPEESDAEGPQSLAGASPMTAAARLKYREPAGSRSTTPSARTDGAAVTDHGVREGAHRPLPDTL